MLQPEHALIFAAAVGPPLLFALAILRMSAAGPSRRGAITAFAWGAVVAARSATVLNDTLGGTQVDWLVPAGLAPVVEEVAKGTGVLLVLAWGSRHDARMGLVVGALTGLGFAAAENVGYYTLAALQAGYAGLGRALYLRGLVQGLNHAAFTAATGAGIGWAWQRAPALVYGLAGLAVAVVAHALWNGVTSGVITEVLCNAERTGGACATAPDALDLFVTSPLLVAMSIGPLALGLWLVARRERQRG